MDVDLQLLPEKYSYFRRVDRANAQLEAGEEAAPIDCVICMAAIDVSQRCNECMVRNLNQDIIVQIVRKAHQMTRFYFVETISR